LLSDIQARRSGQITACFTTLATLRLTSGIRRVYQARRARLHEKISMMINAS
jgi:hypothetical protein